MDEVTAAMKARAFIGQFASPSLPVSVEEYAARINAKIRRMPLEEGEDAWSMQRPDGSYRICVNCAHNARRQRFSICHEVAHAVLGIAPDHSAPSWNFARRPPGEVACDAFAAELLLPYRLLKPKVDAADPSFRVIEMLAREFDASLIATASRFASYSREPCVFILSEAGKVRFSIRSAAMRGAGAWVRVGTDLPAKSMSARVRSGALPDGPEDCDPDLWFDGWEHDDSVYEDTIHLGQHDHTLTLLWMADDELRPTKVSSKHWEEEARGLAELDGVLPWPSRSRRRP